MTEEVPAVSNMPKCNGSVAPEKGPLQAMGDMGDMAKSIGIVPYANADTGPDTPPKKENQEKTRNNLAEDLVHEDCDGEKQCEGKQEESDETLQQEPADVQDTGTNGQESEEGLSGEGTSAASKEPGMVANPSGELVETSITSADGRGNAAEEEEEEEDTEEDDVQVIEIKKNSDTSCLQQPDGSKEASSPTSPSCNSQVEKPLELPSLGKKNDISRHSYSRYNTISYRRIRKGNTKQRIDEFESMMHL
ncbi:ERMIN protein, partial [Bucco capensis]|nr:ERMIN protein [Bucco capensis]